MLKKKLYFQFAGSCCLLLFMFLGYVVRFYPNWLTSFDRLGTAWIRLGYPNWQAFFLWVTKFANPSTVVFLVICLTLFFLRFHRRLDSIWLLFNVGLGAGVANPLLKLFFMRERPSLIHLVEESSYSFPSGHATTSLLLYGTLFLLLPHWLTHKRWQVLCQILLGLLIVLIGVSRVYLGVHFPSDVVAGFSFAAAWLLFFYPIYLQYRFVERFSQNNLHRKKTK